jgi:hypothetical protein
MQLLKPKFLLHAEGAAVLALSLWLYWLNGGNWWMFVLLILAPDLAMLGYLANVRVGSAVYNVVHTYLLPAILIVASRFAQSTLGIELALIWFAHIGGDRLVGYGLKYPTEFKDTHLGRV